MDSTGRDNHVSLVPLDARVREHAPPEGHLSQLRAAIARGEYTACPKRVAAAMISAGALGLSPARATRPG